MNAEIKAQVTGFEQSVATPLEQQMSGVDNALYMQSTNANDGTMTLTVTFDVDTDPNLDQVNVQNRVAQAQPNLPADVNQFGRRNELLSLVQLYRALGGGWQQ